MVKNEPIQPKASSSTIGLKDGEEPSFDDLMQLYPMLLHDITCRVTRSIIAELFPKSEDPTSRSDLAYEFEPEENLDPATETRHSLHRNLQRQVNWLLKHAYTDCEHPDIEFRKQKPVPERVTEPSESSV